MIRLCTVLIFFFFLVVVQVGPYYGHISRFYRAKLSIYLQNYVKNGLIFKTANQKKKISTQCLILLLFLLFSQIKIGVGGALSAPPPPADYHIKLWKKNNKIIWYYIVGGSLYQRERTKSHHQVISNNLILYVPEAVTHFI